MSILRSGTLCVIVASGPENIGTITEVVEHLGPCEGREDACEIKTIKGRPFNQLWNDKDLVRGHSPYAITYRYKLRPLVSHGLGADAVSVGAGHQPAAHVWAGPH